LKELQKRFERNEIQGTAKKEKVKKMDEILSYKTEKQLPKDLKPGLLYVDKNNNTILVPYNSIGAFVPFHVSTIKNVSTTTEGQWTFLRLNFHIPGGSTL
jgi:nucleosome binding factor SPN SPT16 subunit